MTYAGWFEGTNITSDETNCHISIFDHSGDYSVCSISVVVKTVSELYNSSVKPYPVSNYVMGDRYEVIGPAYIIQNQSNSIRIGSMWVNNTQLKLSVEANTRIPAGTIIYCNGTLVGTHLTMYDDSDVDNGYITF